MMTNIQNTASNGSSATPIVKIENLSRQVLLDEAEKLDTELKANPSPEIADKFKSIYGENTADWMLKLNKSYKKRLSKAGGDTLGEIKGKVEAKAQKWHKVADALNIPMTLGGIGALIGGVPTTFCALGEIASVLLWPAHFNGFDALSPIFPQLMMGGGAIAIASLMIWNLASAIEDSNTKFADKLVKWGSHIQAQTPERPSQQETQAA